MARPYQDNTSTRAGDLARTKYSLTSAQQKGSLYALPD